MPRRFLPLLALGVAVLAAGCVGSRRTNEYVPPAVPTAARASVMSVDGTSQFEIDANDDSYESPDELPAGRVSVTLRNQAKQQRNAQFFRVKDGVTLVQVAAAFQRDPRSVVDLVTFAGGPGTVPPGGTQRIVQDLTEGQYIMSTLLLGEDGMQFVPKGMFKTFRVTRAVAPPVTTPMPGDDRIVLADFAFGIPNLTAGSHTLRLDNVGKEPHEILVKRLAPRKTLADSLAFVVNPVGTPPYGDAGGLLVFPGGESTTMDLDLAPGQYVAICYFREPVSSKTHAELGMIRDFSVE
ncbi:MAG TPA: hypothetical protein VFG86_12315 [Chloroflexota bacterium]|nr:hypothetical protein [Chloroflexota bacterium]